MHRLSTIVPSMSKNRESSDGGGGREGGREGRKEGGTERGQEGGRREGKRKGERKRVKEKRGCDGKLMKTMCRPG